MNKRLTSIRLSTAIILSISLLGCVGKNPFEDAVDPQTGSREKWRAWVDDGGLNKLSDFYGLDIRNVNVTWNQGKVESLAMFTSKTHSPKDVRKAMSKICGGADSDWEREENWARHMGKLENSTATCRYLDDGRGMWELLYIRRK